MSSSSSSSSSSNKRKLQQERQYLQLPVYLAKYEFLKQFKKHQVIVVEGPTGSGKTTQIPKIVYDFYTSQRKQGIKIVITQTRTIAATTLAKKVQEEYAEDDIHSMVGYQIRNSSTIGNTTPIRFVTDGILVNEAKDENKFDQYDCIILDEAHERTINTDILMAWLKLRLLKNDLKNELKVIIMSATICSEDFVKFFTIDGKVPALVKVNYICPR
jgi:HrpA-like RNA helicase